MQVDSQFWLNCAFMFWKWIILIKRLYVYKNVIFLIMNRVIFVVYINQDKYSVNKVLGDFFPLISLLEVILVGVKCFEIVYHFPCIQQTKPM